jgi:hypothetical protein
MIRTFTVCLALIAGLPASADGIHLVVKVAEASTSGTQVAPELAHMSRDFKRKGLAFTSYKLLAQQSLTIERNAATPIPVPGAPTITLTWTGESAGKLEFRVDVPGQPELNLRVHGGGSSFVEAGKGPDGSVILMELKHLKNIPGAGEATAPTPAPH